jgi:Bacterial SH3 domain
MQRLALFACTFMLLTGAAAARPGTAVSTVNLRAEANTNSAILAKIPGGSRIEVGDCTEGWCAVTFQGKSGFAIATALDTSGRVVRRAPPRPLPPGVGPDDDFVPAAPGYGPGYAVVPPPPVVYYGPGPYWGPYWGWGYRRWGWRRW